MNIYDMACWQILEIQGIEHLCLTQEDWDALSSSDKSLQNGIPSCRTPLTRHWLAGITHLPVVFTSRSHVEDVRARAKKSARAHTGISLGMLA